MAFVLWLQLPSGRGSASRWRSSRRRTIALATASIPTKRLRRRRSWRLMTTSWCSPPTSSSSASGYVAADDTVVTCLGFITLWLYERAQDLCTRRHMIDVVTKGALFLGVERIPRPFGGLSITPTRIRELIVTTLRKRMEIQHIYRSNWSGVLSQSEFPRILRDDDFYTSCRPCWLFEKT